MDEDDLFEVVSALFDAVDPEVLEALALTKLEGLDGGMNTGAAFREAMREMVLGGDRERT